MFYIKTQNGSISSIVKAQILGDFAAQEITGDSGEAKLAGMRVIVNRRADAANPKRIEVRARKLTIAGGVGTAHGNRYDLAQHCGIRLALTEQTRTRRKERERCLAEDWARRPADLRRKSGIVGCRYLEGRP
jgi:hypothetical protein